MAKQTKENGVYIFDQADNCILIVDFHELNAYLLQANIDISVLGSGQICINTDLCYAERDGGVSHLHNKVKKICEKIKALAKKPTEHEMIDMFNSLRLVKKLPGCIRGSQFGSVAFALSIYDWETQEKFLSHLVIEPSAYYFEGQILPKIKISNSCAGEIIKE